MHKPKLGENSFSTELQVILLLGTLSNNNQDAVYSFKGERWPSSKLQEQRQRPRSKYPLYSSCVLALSVVLFCFAGDEAKAERRHSGAAKGQLLFCLAALDTRKVRALFVPVGDSLCLR